MDVFLAHIIYFAFLFYESPVFNVPGEWITSHQSPIDKAWKSTVLYNADQPLSIRDLYEIYCGMKSAKDVTIKVLSYTTLRGPENCSISAPRIVVRKDKSMTPCTFINLHGSEGSLLQLVETNRAFKVAFARILGLDKNDGTIEEEFDQFSINRILLYASQHIEKYPVQVTYRLSRTTDDKLIVALVGYDPSVDKYLDSPSSRRLPHSVISFNGALRFGEVSFLPILMTFEGENEFFPVMAPAVVCEAWASASMHYNSPNDCLKWILDFQKSKINTKYKTKGVTLIPSGIKS